MIYLDFSATSPLLPEVKAEMNRVMELEIGNPSSLHSSGQLAKEEMNRARVQIAKLIEARPLEMVFTSGGTESNNTVVHIFGDCPIFVSAIEHPSILRPAETYSKSCTKIPVNKQGIIDLSFLKENLIKTIEDNPKQKILVSIMLANNEVGTIEPIKEVSNLITELRAKYHAKVYLHTDATQAVGKIPVSVKDLGVDYLTFTSHKLGGPIGIAALFVKSGSPFKPLLLGGAQENKRRPGTSNALLASGFKVASSLALSTPQKYQKVEELRNYLAERIKASIPDSMIITPIVCLPNILNVSFPAAEGESTQLYLDLEGIEVSTGSACASGDLEPSHVLMALFNDAEIAHGSVRFSLGLNTTKSEIDELLKKLPPIIKRVQDLSTLKKEPTDD